MSCYLGNGGENSAIFHTRVTPQASQYVSVSITEKPSGQNGHFV